MTGEALCVRNYLRVSPGDISQVNYSRCASDMSVRFKTTSGSSFALKPETAWNGQRTKTQSSMFTLTSWMHDHLRIRSSKAPWKERQTRKKNWNFPAKIFSIKHERVLWAGRRTGRLTYVSQSSWSENDVRRSLWCRSNAFLWPWIIVGLAALLASEKRHKIHGKHSWREAIYIASFCIAASRYEKVFTPSRLIAMLRKWWAFSCEGFRGAGLDQTITPGGPG